MPGERKYCRESRGGVPFSFTFLVKFILLCAPLAVFSRVNGNKTMNVKHAYIILYPLFYDDSEINCATIFLSYKVEGM